MGLLYNGYRFNIYLRLIYILKIYRIKKLFIKKLLSFIILYIVRKGIWCKFKNLSLIFGVYKNEIENWFLMLLGLKIWVLFLKYIYCKLKNVFWSCFLNFI